MDFDFNKVLKTVAPWAATAITGPLGGLAVGMLGDAIGLTDKTQEGLKAALAGASPADLLALKKADADFALQMQALGFKNISDLEKISADDRANARDMQKTIKSKVPSFLSTLVTVGYFGILIGMMEGGLKLDDSQALLLMLGSLTTAWGMVMAYWFGTTSSSSVKTDLIAKANAKA